MPRFQDSALHTPEKIRAASSLWRLGGAWFLIAVFIFADYLIIYANQIAIGGWRYMLMPIDLLIALSLLVAGSLLAITAGIGICRRRRWKRIACRLAFLVSLLYLSLLWLGCIIGWLSRTPMNMHNCVLVIFLAGCTFLFGVAIVRYNQFSRAERRRIAVPRKQ